MKILEKEFKKMLVSGKNFSSIEEICKNKKFLEKIKNLKYKHLNSQSVNLSSSYNTNNNFKKVKIISNQIKAYQQPIV